MPDPTAAVRAALSAGSAHHALELVLAAAKEAGERVIRDNRRLPPDQQLALALQAADEAMEEIAVELTVGGEAREDCP